MATIIASRSTRLHLLLCCFATATALGPGRATAGDLRTPQPVAYYDVDVVARDARALEPEWRRAVAVEERLVAESAPLRAQVAELRTLLGDAALADRQRRVFETQLAQRTIALLLLRADGMRDIAQAKALALDDVEERITAAVARVARENGYVIVIRTDRATRVLDRDAIDLTPRVIAELDRAAGTTQETRAPAPAPAPREPGLAERLRTRGQACDGPAAASAACASADAGS